MQQYHNLLNHILKEGSDKTDRTGVGTKSVFGYQMRFNLKEGFPLITTKKIHFKSIAHELIWFLSGNTNIKYLKDNGVSIWDAWANESGDLGPVYGKQWRNFGSKQIDQIKNVIEQIKTNPDSRRLIVCAWNPEEVSEMALPPCHTLFQFYVDKNELSCHLYQRSGDAFLGVPFNIASYALLTEMIAQVCGLKAKEFIHSFGDLHIYNNHFEQVNIQLNREFKKLPKLWLNPNVKDINNFTYEDIKILDYDPQPTIKAEVAI